MSLATATRVRKATASLPSPATTETAVYDELRKRDAGLCGYVSGNAQRPVECAAGYTCSNINGYRFGCCNQVNCYNDWNTCQAVGGNVCPGLASSECSNIYTSILDCTAGVNTLCFQYEFSASLDADSTLFSWACGATANDIGILGYATNGGGGQTSSGSSFSSSSGSSSFGGGGSGGGGGTGGTTTNTPSGHTSLSSGAIAGIAVGAVFLLAILGIVGCYFWRKGRRHRDEVLDAQRPDRPGQVMQQGSVYSGTIGQHNGPTNTWVQSQQAAASQRGPASDWSGPTAWSRG